MTETGKRPATSRLQTASRKPEAFRPRALATTEARKALPQLVNAMGAKRTASVDLMQDAVAIGPHRKGGAVLLPGIDLAAHATEVAELRARVEQLEEDLEDAGMALFLQERLASTSGQRLSVEQFLTEIGMEGHVEQLPER